MLKKKAEDRIEFIRQNPQKDRYGRPVVDGTPLGSGDASWRLHYGFAGYESSKCVMLGIGIPRDSFLPQECRNNEKNALRDTPRSSKITKEVKKWAIKHKLYHKPVFMKKLRMVHKRVYPIESLKLPQYMLDELKPMIYRFSSYKLLDKREPNAHFGSSTRVQMTQATLWKCMGDPGNASACKTTYRPKYKYLDEQRPRTHMGTSTREQMTKAQMWASFGGTGEASTEATYDRNFSLVDRRQPAVHFGTAKRPSPLIRTGAHDAPIYMVQMENHPQYLPRYKTFGAKYKSFGPRPEERSKSRVPKPTEWGPPPPKPGEINLDPMRYGMNKNLKYSQYKFRGLRQPLYHVNKKDF